MAFIAVQGAAPIPKDATAGKLPARNIVFVSLMPACAQLGPEKNTMEGRIQ